MPSDGKPRAAAICSFCCTFPDTPPDTGPGTSFKFTNSQILQKIYPRPIKGEKIDKFQGDCAKRQQTRSFCCLFKILALLDASYKPRPAASLKFTNNKKNRNIFPKPIQARDVFHHFVWTQRRQSESFCFLFKILARRHAALTPKPRSSFEIVGNIIFEK